MPRRPPDVYVWRQSARNKQEGGDGDFRLEQTPTNVPLSLRYACSLLGVGSLCLQRRVSSFLSGFDGRGVNVSSVVRAEHRAQGAWQLNHVGRASFARAHTTRTKKCKSGCGSSSIDTTTPRSNTIDVVDNNSSNEAFRGKERLKTKSGHRVQHEGC